MQEKTRIIEALGETRLLLPALLNEALAANDRIKYRLALVQAAGQHADRPDDPAPNLRAERMAAGVLDDSWDTFVAGARRSEPGRYSVGRLRELLDQASSELDSMLAPLSAAGSGEAAAFARRLAAAHGTLLRGDDDIISCEEIARLASGDRGSGDSVHLLVMDMHRALNSLQSEIAEETIAGARCYGLDPEDRSRVAAFMTGVNRTRHLKLDHPGLNTTATRMGEKLAIQNDLGTTDAHVLVVHVQGLSVQITYTDVHMQRLLFFQSLFEAWNVEWEDTRSRTDAGMEDGIYHLSAGRFTARDTPEVERYLAFLGSRLVFIIDWNRARKRLRMLLPKRDCLAILKWAADNDIGHMAFLRLDAAHLVFAALAQVRPGALTPDSRIDALLGRENAVEYLKFVLRICSEGLSQGRPTELLQDEIRAELVGYLQSTEQSLHELALEHAAYAVEIASGVRDCLLHASESTAAVQFALNAARAKRWEHEADALVNRSRELAQRSERAAAYRELIERADDIADELEEAAFHLTLLPSGDGALAPCGSLSELAGLLVSSSQEYVKALSTARSLRRGAPREDMQEFLQAIHRIVVSERDSDEAQRKVKTTLVSAGMLCEQLFALSECARALEAAADALMHAALLLRDHVLAEVMER